jgi:hypothetical protein
MTRTVQSPTILGLSAEVVELKKRKVLGEGFFI